MILEHLERWFELRAVDDVFAVESGCAFVLFGSAFCLSCGLGFLVPVQELVSGCGELARRDIDEQGSDRVFGHERAVILLALHDLVGHAQRQGRIRSWLDGDEPVGVTRRGIKEQTYVHDLGAP